MNGLLFGLIAGAGAALLLAPSTGVEMREKLTDLTDGLRERVNEYLGETGEGPSHTGSSRSGK